MVVTAQRRSENLQKAAVSVDALSQVQLVANGITDPTLLNRQVPGLLVPPSGGGAVNYFIRGTGNFVQEPFSLSELRRAGLVRSQRGADGGYALARPADEITIGAVIRVVDGPLAEVHGLRPNETAYTGVAEHLPDIWVAMRAALRGVLDETSLQDVLTGKLPEHVKRMAQDPDAWGAR